MGPIRACFIRDGTSPDPTMEHGLWTIRVTSRFDGRSTTCRNPLAAVMRTCFIYQIRSNLIQVNRQHVRSITTSCAGGRHNMPRPCVLDFDHLTLQMVSESRVTWATSVLILVLLVLFVLDLGPMYSIDRHQTASTLNAPPA